MRTIVGALLLAACGSVASPADAPAGGDGVSPPPPDSPLMTIDSFQLQDGGCSGIGRACATDMNCAGGLTCYSGSAGGVCAVPRSICGGVAGAECPDEAALCMVLQGTDFGLCASAPEAACICAEGSGATTSC
jgi:hypothetical protein